MDITLRRDAEDVAVGTPLSGPDKLVDRIEDALSCMESVGYEEGHTEGHGEGYDEGCDKALGSMVAALWRHLSIEVELNSTDDVEVSIDKIIEAVKKSLTEQFNQGVDALAAELDTKRAAEVAETVWKTDEN